MPKERLEVDRLTAGAGVVTAVGAGWMNAPNALGLLPTGIVVVTVLVAVAITETVPEALLLAT